LYSLRRTPTPTTYEIRSRLVNNHSNHDSQKPNHTVAPGVMMEFPLASSQILAYFPPNVKATDVQVSVNHFGVDSMSDHKPLVVTQVRSERM